MKQFKQKTLYVSKVIKKSAAKHINNTVCKYMQQFHPVIEMFHTFTYPQT